MSFTGNMAKAYQVHRRKFLFAGGLLGLFGIQQYTQMNPFAAVLKTSGVQNIEDRYSSGGGSKDHTPGAATTLGKSDQVTGNVKSPSGIGSEHYQEKVAGQKPDPTGFDKAWNKSNYGNEKGK